jgi:hypothetical protein
LGLGGHFPPGNGLFWPASTQLYPGCPEIFTNGIAMKTKHFADFSATEPRFPQVYDLFLFHF